MNTPTQSHFGIQHPLKTLSSLALVSSLSLGLIACTTTSQPQVPAQPQALAQPQAAETVLAEDRVVAFGLPTQAQPDIQEHHAVIAGAKNSYVIRDGGMRFLSLITQLNALNLQIDKNLKFISHENDGRFNADINMNYVKLIEDLSKEELLFLYQHNAKNCTSTNDNVVHAMRFCVNVKLTGDIFPAVTNLKDLNVDLSRFGQPYHITILSNAAPSQTPLLQQRPNAPSFALQPFQFTDTPSN